MQKIYSCLWFDGQAKAAADLYCSIFENSKITVDTPMVVNFELNGKKFMGLNGGPMFKVNPSISFFVIYNSDEEINSKWNKLSDGGKVMMGLDKYPWSERYGWCQDKFGISWQLMMGKMQGETIVPALMFTKDNSGRAGEAIDFYSSVFKNAETKMISRYEKGEPDVEGYIKHAQFSLENELFIAMDSSAAHAFTFNEGISLVVDCKDQEEVDYYWNKLIADGGQESMCAWLKDKFGVSWQIVPTKLGELIGSPDKEKANRAMQAMLKMRKIVIADLQKAYDGN